MNNVLGLNIVVIVYFIMVSELDSGNINLWIQSWSLSESFIPATLPVSWSLDYYRTPKFAIIKRKTGDVRRNIIQIKRKRASGQWYQAVICLCNVLKLGCSLYKFPGTPVQIQLGWLIHLLYTCINKNFDKSKQENSES